MVNMKFTVRGQSVSVTQRTIVEGSIKYLEASFAFSDDWNGLAKTVTFSKGDESVRRVILNDRIAEEDDLQLSEGTWTVDILGVGEEGKRITTSPAIVTVKPRTNVEGEEVEPEKISLFERFISFFEGVRNDVLSGKFNGKDGYTPVKGKDYFDGEPGEPGYTPVKGKDYFDGKDGSDASVTAENIASALSYTPADETEVSELKGDIVNLENQISEEVESSYLLINPSTSHTGLANKPNNISTITFSTNTNYTANIYNVAEGEYKKAKSSGYANSVMNPHVMFFDSNGNFISSYIESGGYIKDAEWDIPENARTIIVNGRTSSPVENVTSMYVKTEGERVLDLDGKIKRLAREEIVPLIKTGSSNSSYIRADEGYVHGESTVVPSWSEWDKSQYNYGQLRTVIPRYNEFHGTIMTDGMFTNIAKYVRWGSEINGYDHLFGGHVAEFWNSIGTYRATIIMGKNAENEACIVSFSPSGCYENPLYPPNEAQSSNRVTQSNEDLQSGSSYFGKVRIGSDEPSHGFLFSRDFLKAYGDIAIARKPPESSGSNGKQGTITFDDNYLYICVSDNNWKRVSLEYW